MKKVNHIRIDLTCAIAQRYESKTLDQLVDKYKCIAAT